MNDTNNFTVTKVGLGVATLLLIVGHWLPWAAHKTAALTLSANDLAFFTNYTPGAGIFLNEWFCLPVWVAAIMFLVIGYELSSLDRLLLGGVSLAVASFGLPRFEQLIKFMRTPTQAFRESEFVLQLLLTLGVMGLVLIVLAKTRAAKTSQVGAAKTPAGLRLMRQPATFAVAMLASAVLCAVPLVGYLSIRPFVAELYRDDVGIGSGWWLTLLADLLLWTVTFATIIHTNHATSTVASHTAHQQSHPARQKERT
jgi:hypothetical protein